MDEEYSEEVAAISPSGNDQVHGKATDVLLKTESYNTLESQDITIHREGSYSRSSTQELMDVLEGKNTGGNLSLVHSCSSSMEGLKGTVHHSSQENYSDLLALGNDKDLMETRQADSLHVNEPTSEPEPEPGSSMRHDVCNDSGQSSRRGKSSRILSKRAVSEHFVKNSLEGEGLVCSGERLAVSCVEFRSQNAGPRFCATPDSSSDGESLREWLRTSCNKQRKAHGLPIFKKILDIVGSFHSKGKVLQDLRPSCFKLLPANEVMYTGRINGSMPNGRPNLQILKRPGIYSSHDVCEKREKLDDNVRANRDIQQFQFGYGLIPTGMNDIGVDLGASVRSRYSSDSGSYSSVRFESCGNPSSSHLLKEAMRLSSGADYGENKWYVSPEERSGMVCTSSNIYSLGILLFELLSCFDSVKAHASAMSDLCHRIFPPKLLSENPKEAAFCLWLLHPQPSLRPTICDILQSEFVSGFQKMLEDDLSPSIYEDETEIEVLLDFLLSVKEKKETHASILAEEIRYIETDIKEAEKRASLSFPLMPSCSQWDSFDTKERVSSLPALGRDDSRWLSCVSQLESAYFSARSQIPLIEEDPEVRPDVHLLSSRENYNALPSQEKNKCQLDIVGAFFDGLCKYARYSKLEVCGTVRNRDFTNSAKVICSLSFDRDEAYLASAGVSKKVKLFEFETLCSDDVDTHYPVAEMSNSSKISCVSWNAYVRNYLASADYDGIVKIWDASTGQGVSEYMEHEQRAWSVDFSRLDPMKLASASDDCTVRIWSLNERNSLCSIRSIANVCCVQYSDHSSHLLAFGSADCKIYCYDLRNADVPWCVLAGHEKAVSYIKFLDSETLVSASTDGTLRRWDLRRSNSLGLSHNACNLTFKGHTNNKNFVGLSVQDGFIACGSETNEVYTYYKSFPMPITAHKFGAVEPITEEETDDDNGEFVSSVCWRGTSNFMVAANSTGCIKVLRMA